MKNKKVIESLKQMPKIQGTLNKEELYQRISSNTHKKQQKSSKRVPIIGAIMAIAIISFVLPIVINNVGEQSADRASEKSTLREESADYGYEDESSIKKEDAEQKFKTMNAAPKSYIIQTLDNNSQIIHGTIMDTKLQNGLPISFVVPKSADIGDYENKIDNYIKEDKWNLNDYLSKDYSFVLEDNNQLVKASYKLYKSQLLIPVPQEGKTTIDDALLEMKQTQKTNTVYPTIPATVHYSIDKSEKNKLIIHFNAEAELGDNQATITMIEAILMTAKSYDYVAVTFKDLPVEQIGPYNVSGSIKVPDAVNPINLME